MGNGGRDRSTARLTLGVGLAVSAFPLSVPVDNNLVMGDVGKSVKLFFNILNL